MRKSFLYATIVLALLSGCAQNGSFAQRDEVSEWDQIFAFSGENATAAVNPPTDIIFLLDNSGSMQDETLRLRNALTELTGSLANEQHVDYRVYGLNLWSMWANSQGVMEVQSYNFDSYSDRNSFSVFNTFISDESYFSPFMDSYTIENGIALAGGALQTHYFLKPDLSRQTKNIEFVMMSDEDNDFQKYVHPLTGEVQYAAYRDYLMSGPNIYNYRMGYDSGRTTLTVANRCIASPNTYNAIPGDNSGRYYCRTSSNEGRFTSYTATHIADVPNSYLCMVTSDNHTQEMERWSWGPECRINPNATYNRQLTSHIYNSTTKTYAMAPGVNNAVPVTCTEQQYIPTVYLNGKTNWNYSNVPITSITTAACKSGFATAYAQYGGSNYSVLLDPSFVAPQGVTVAPSARIQNNFSSTEYYATDEELIAAYQLMVPSAKNITVESRPESEGAETSLYLSNPQDFKRMLKERFPHLNVAFNAIVAQKDGACREGDQSNNVEGKRYKLMAEMTKGFVGDICDLDFKPLMKKLARNVLFNSRPQYPLKGYANPHAVLEVIDQDTGDPLTKDVHYEITPDRLHIRFVEGAVDLSHKFKINQIRPN